MSGGWENVAGAILLGSLVLVIMANTINLWKFNKYLGYIRRQLDEQVKEQGEAVRYVIAAAIKLGYRSSSPQEPNKADAEIVRKQEEKGDDGDDGRRGFS
jgi:hypothetical protein